MLGRHPDNLDVRLCLGNVEFLAGRHDAAARAYRTALAARPDWAEAKKNLALTLERTGEASDARELWRALVSHEAFGAEARLRLAASER